ncbi:MAG TPA: polysaccharide deacetylase family protein, partial [Cellvibrionaceae bacterium]|nr:polysaccharide deacetylase family protein [Cellvibrionaceae bacterium]
ADDARCKAEEPGMCVTPEVFAMHLAQLRRYLTPMFLSDWVAKSRRGEALPARACAVTFDDGWRDNFEFALPLLEQARVPATLFAVAEKIGTDFQFWPNLVANLLLQGALPQLQAHPIFQALHEAVPGLATGVNRERLALAIHFLKRYPDQEIFTALAQLNGQSLAAPLPRALMDWHELAQMQASGWVEIGSHTCTHRRLTSALDESQLRYEIQHSQSLLQERLGRAVNLFCFPNGDYSPTALQIVEETYQAAVTTQRGIAHVGQNLHELKRIGLHNDISATPVAFGARLSAWM